MALEIKKAVPASGAFVAAEEPTWISFAGTPGGTLARGVALSVVSQRHAPRRRLVEGRAGKSATPVRRREGSSTQSPECGGVEARQLVGISKRFELCGEPRPLPVSSRLAWPVA